MKSHPPMVQTIYLHNITEIEVSAPERLYTNDTEETVIVNIKIRDGNGQSFDMSAFALSRAALTLRLPAATARPLTADDHANSIPEGKSE